MKDKARAEDALRRGSETLPERIEGTARNQPPLAMIPENPAVSIDETGSPPIWFPPVSTTRPVIKWATSSGRDREERIERLLIEIRDLLKERGE